LLGFVSTFIIPHDIVNRTPYTHDMVRNVKIPCGIEMQAEIIVKLESMEPCNSVKVLFQSIF
jgi:hypothetical protein